MRVAFAGTPPFAARALEALSAAGHEIVLVLTQPDRPAGRGLKLTPSAVAHVAATLAVPVQKFPTLKDPDAQECLCAAGIEVLVVAAYGLLLPKAVLEIPARGCLNIHASLLPRWRGAAPIHRAILSGDIETGICIMQMDEGLDTGPVLLRRRLAIEPRDNTGTLTARLSDLGAAAIVEALDSLQTLVPQPQDNGLATYAQKVRKTEAQLDWAAGCEELDRKVRAFNPAPGTDAMLSGEPVRIWEADPMPGLKGLPGAILKAKEGELIVACGSGALALKTLQRAGGRRMGAAEFLRGKQLKPDVAPI